jgi:hypothetical protein
MSWPEAFVYAVAMVCGTFLVWRLMRWMSDGEA